MSIVFLVTVGVAAFYVIFMRDDVYEASAKVLVKIGHEQAIPSTVRAERPMMIIGQRYQDVNSEVEILMSNDLLGRVVDKLGLDKPGPPPPPPQALFPRIRHEIKQVVRSVKEWKNEMLIRLGFRLRLTPREEAVAMLQKGLLVVSVRDSNVIAVKLYLPAREFVSPILNELIDMYRDFRLGMFLDKQAVTFFETETQTAADTLAAAERELHEFEAQGDIQSVSDQIKTLLQQAADARTEQERARITLQTSEARLTRFNADAAAAEPNFAGWGEFPADSFVGKLLLKLVELEQQRRMLNLTPVADSALITANREQFQDLFDVIVSHLRVALEEQRRTFETRSAVLLDLEGRLTALHAREMPWRMLRRAVQVAETTYLSLQKRLEEARATSAMEERKLGNVEIVEHGMAPLGSAGIRKLTLLGIALAAGFVAALAWASLAEFFDHRVYDPQTAEAHVGAPVVAVVPVGRGRRGRMLSREQTVLAGARRRR